MTHDIEQELIAEIIWNRFAPEYEDEWPSPNASEYRLAARAVLAALRAKQPAPQVKALEVPPGLIEALRSGEQADMDGTMVRVSRQACEMAADILSALSVDAQR